MNEVVTKLGEGGRIVVPVEYRNALGVKPGDELVLLLEKDSIRLISRAKAVKRSQGLVRQYIKEGGSLSEQLIQERRDEAGRE